MIQLSERLRAIAEKVEPGSRLADIGSDHALLPSFLAERGIVPFAVAGELNPGPYEAARKQVQEARLTATISVRRGDGLEVVHSNEVDCITVAGMGGNLIVHILTEGQAAGKLEGVRKLVLQPNVGEEAVRRWLLKNGWTLLGEQILEEDGKIYEIIWGAASGNGEDAVYRPIVLEGFGELNVEDLLRFGPYLLREASPVFLDKWRREAEKLSRIAAQLAQSELEEARGKRELLLADIDRVKELIACLQKAKPSFS